MLVCGRSVLHACQQAGTRRLPAARQPDSTHTTIRTNHDAAIVRSGAMTHPTAPESGLSCLHDVFLHDTAHSYPMQKAPSRLLPNDLPAGGLV